MSDLPVCKRHPDAPHRTFGTINRCSECGEPGDSPKETFPRGPSSEAQLYAELNAAQAEIVRLKQELIRTRLQGDEALQRLDDQRRSADIRNEAIDTLAAQRDALAVANERMRLAILRMARMMPHHIALRRIGADVLNCTIEELDQQTEGEDS